MSLDETQLRVLSVSGTPQQQAYARKIEPIRKNGHLLLVSRVPVHLTLERRLWIIAFLNCPCYSSLTSFLFLSIDHFAPRQHDCQRDPTHPQRERFGRRSSGCRRVHHSHRSVRDFLLCYERGADRLHMTQRLMFPLHLALLKLSPKASAVVLVRQFLI